MKEKDAIEAASQLLMEEIVGAADIMNTAVSIAQISEAELQVKGIQIINVFLEPQAPVRVMQYFVAKNKHGKVCTALCSIENNAIFDQPFHESLAWSPFSKEAVADDFLAVLSHMAEVMNGGEVLN